MYLMPSSLSQSSISAIQQSSLSERPSDRMVLMPSWLHSFIMSDRSSTRQCAWSAEITEALPCLPQGWRARCSSLNGKPSAISWLITCSAPALVLSTLDAPAYEMIWNSIWLPATLVNERSFSTNREDNSPMGLRAWSMVSCQSMQTTTLDELTWTTLETKLGWCW